MMEIEPWHDVDLLLLAVGGRDDGVRDAIDRVGLRRAASVVVEEVMARCDPPELESEVQVQFEITHRGQREGYTLAFAKSGLTPERGWAEDSLVRITYEAEDVIRCLFGSDNGRPSTSRQVHVTWPSSGNLMTAFSLATTVPVAIDAVLAACSATCTDLSRLCVRFGSDKWGALHWYTPHYEHHFGRMRDEPVRLLEIGVGGFGDPASGGASLRMWQRYFRRGLIYGLDVFPKPAVRGPRIRTVRGDQSDAAFLADLGAELGPFDIVIDDGSHINQHVLTSVRELFPHVSPGGLYVIEDLQTSYWPGYGGRQNDFASGETTVGFVKRLLDGLHHHEWQDARDHQPEFLDQHVTGVHVYRNLAVIEKGANTEDAAPPWVPRKAFGR